MTSAKYIGMDVHKETISIAVMNSAANHPDLEFCGGRREATVEA